MVLIRARRLDVEEDTNYCLFPINVNFENLPYLRCFLDFCAFDRNS